MNQVHNQDRQDDSINAFELLMQVANSVFQYSDNSLYRAGRLTSAKFIQLKLIDLFSGKITNAELAKLTNTKRSNITQVTSDLKKLKLVEVRRRQDDKRFIDIMITQEGKKLLAEALPIASKVVKNTMKGISQRQLKQLMRYLNIIKMNIDNTAIYHHD